MNERKKRSQSPTFSTAANTTSAATRSKPATPSALRRCPKTCRPTAWAWLNGCCAPSIRSRPASPSIAFGKSCSAPASSAPAGDFGVAGELPSHPELLDWLAVEFRESGWDVKKFFKLLVTSNTYRQAATATPEKLTKDPDNRLLSRGPRFRMDAEMVRDYALAASGLLSAKSADPASGRISPKASGKPWP